MATQNTIYFKDCIIKRELCEQAEVTHGNSIFEDISVDTRNINFNKFNYTENKESFFLSPGSCLLLQFDINKSNVKFYINNYLFIAGVIYNYIYTDKGLLIRILNSNKSTSIKITKNTVLGLIKYD